jgi:tetratricopeptide (TPR) repeat protein
MLNSRRNGRWGRSASAALVFGALALDAAAASAQSAQSQAAEALFRQARALLEKGELAAACEKFAASQELEPGLGTLLYLGDCYERAGRFASALGTFREAAELAKLRDDAARLRLAEIRVSALVPRAPTLEIRQGPAAQPIDLQITVGGAPLRRTDLGRAVPRDAGKYEIRFSAPGHEPFLSHIELKNADAVVVTVPRLVPISAPAGGGAAPGGRDGFEEPDGSLQRTLAWIVGGTGAALGVTAGVFAVLAAGKNGDSKNDCDERNQNLCGPTGVELRNDAKNLANLATIFSVLGGVGVAGGFVLYVSAPDTEDPIGQAALIGVRASVF